MCAPMKECQKPLLLTTNEYERILKWTGENKEEQEAARKREYVKYLDETSRAMTKAWPNSVENINKRNEQLRQERIQAAENANTQFYKRYVKQKIEEQERLMYSAKDTMFKNQDAPRTMNSAVISSYILKEREEQKKFLKKLQDEAAEQKRQDEEDIIRRAKEWHQLQKEKQRRRREVDKNHQKELVEQAKYREEKERNQHDNEIEQEKLDNKKAAAEMAAIAKYESDYNKNLKQSILADMQRAKEERERRIKEQADIDKLDDRLIEVLQRNAAKVNKLRKQAEAEERAEKLRVLADITSRLQTGDAERDRREAEIRERVQREKDALADAAIAAQRAKQEKLRQERIQMRKDFLEQERQRQHEEETRRQWEMMNRFKNDERFKEYEKKQRDIQRAKIEKFRNDMLQQQEEMRQKLEKEKADEIRDAELLKEKMRNEDNRLLTYTQQLIDECRAKGWPTYPIEKARHEFCNKYKLYAETPLPKPLQAHFPEYRTVDRSKPDPHYRMPPSPHPLPSPDGPDDKAPAKEPVAAPPAPAQAQPPPQIHERADGLQEVVTDPKREQKKINQLLKPKESAAEYKRVGPVNGLQASSLAELCCHVTSLPVRPCACCKELMPTC